MNINILAAGVQLDDPVLLATTFNASQPAARPLVFWNGKWYRYNGTRYRPVEEVHLVHDLAEHIENMFARDHAAKIAARGDDDPDEKTPKKLKTTDATVGNALSRLKGMRAQPARGVEAAPAWLAGEPVDVLPLTNGLLDPMRGTLHPHTPDYFGLSCTGYEYDAEATCPAWERFLNEQWADDPESKDTLSEWFGLMLTKMTQYQKILLLKGPARSGKGTIIRVLTELVGPELVITKDATTFSGTFGASDLPGKTICIFPELRINWRTEVVALTTRLLSISGGDVANIDVKNRELVSAKLPVRFFLATNQDLDFGDSSGAMASRLLVLKHRKSFVGSEDTGLLDRLRAELPGILNWALRGLARLLERGRFHQPDSGLGVLQVFKDANDKVGSFVRDKLVHDPAAVTPKEKVYEDYQRWVVDNGMKALSQPHFSSALMTDERVTETRRRIDGARVQCYAGVRLRTDSDPDHD